MAQPIRRDHTLFSAACKNSHAIIHMPQKEDPWTETLHHSVHTTIGSDN
jgi:hypothetical protein